MYCRMKGCKDSGITPSNIIKMAKKEAKKKLK